MSKPSGQSISPPQGATHIERLPTLYGVEKNGKIKTWVANIYLKGTNAQTGNAFATIEHGQQDGKKQMTVRDYTEGKNIGKKKRDDAVTAMYCRNKKEVA